MKYKKIVVFTKTLWNEPPRIRHQLSRLLVSKGHQVTFFERSNSQQLRTIKYEKEGISFIRHFELLHHQLRPFKFLVLLNQFVAKIFIKNHIKHNDIDLIINFNYDYDFVKELFPNKKVITIINDDFVSQAKPWMKTSIENQLHTTCEKSDFVFTMHHSLYKDLKIFNKSTHILYPWAEKNYKYPASGNNINRDVVLFWGYIDNRVDWKSIEFLLNHDIKLRFVGILENSLTDKIKKYKKYKNFELLSATSIDKLNFDDVCCSIIPYDTSVGGVNAITISNRTFQLLSYGIPIVHAALPNLIHAPSTVISKCENSKDYLNAVTNFTKFFSKSQEDIQSFLTEHYADSRYKYLFGVLGETFE